MCSDLWAQQNLFYNHYYLNPFLYNPSYIAPNGYSELYLNYRKQWSGIEGAPTTGTVSLHLPLNYKAGIAFTGYQDEAGVLKTTTGLISFAYQVYLGRQVSDQHKIGFGLSAGMTTSTIDGNTADNPNDPVIGSTSSMDGQFGVHYQFRNLKLGFAIPRIFQTYVVAEDDFNKPGIEQVKNTISSISYTIRLSERFVFEPLVSYRTFENQDAQYEAVGVFRVDNVGWLGGAYRQDYGAAAFLGFNIKDRIKVGYAYEFATDQVNVFGDGSHEVQLVVRLGKKKFSRPQALVKEKPVEEVPPQEQETEPAEEQPVEEKKEDSPQQPLDEKQEEPAVPANVQPTEEPLARKDEATPETSAPTPKEEDQQVKSLDGRGLPPGHYVVVGAFQGVENAKNYAQTLKRAGYPANVAYHPEKGYYLVHMVNAPTVEEARQLRDKYRQMSRYSFRDTWILSIE
jgi:type IX secretion system PorP/SprF family membrane protein